MASPREIKEAVITAANLVGSDKRGKGGLVGYMRRLVVRNEAVFGGLLRQVMGSQVTIEHTERAKTYQSVEEVVEELRRFGIVPMQQKALPHYLGPELELDPKDVVEVKPEPVPVEANGKADDETR